MPIRQRENKWYWGSKGPFDSRKKAEKVAQAAHASGYVTKLLNFTKAEGDLEGIKPIEGIGSPTSDRENYEGNQITTRKYIKDPKDAPEVNGEKVKVYEGPDEGYFYDYTLLNTTDHTDELMELVEDAYDDVRDFAEDLVEGFPRIGGERNPESEAFLKLIELPPWHSINILKEKKADVEIEIEDATIDIMKEKYPDGEWLDDPDWSEGLGTPIPLKLAYFDEFYGNARGKALEKNPKLLDAYEDAQRAIDDGIRRALLADRTLKHSKGYDTKFKETPYGETGKQAELRIKLEKLQTNIVRAVFHSLRGEMSYHNGEDSITTAKNVTVKGIDWWHSHLVNSVGEDLANGWDAQYWERKGLNEGWQSFIQKANSYTLNQMFKRYETKAQSLLGIYVNSQNTIQISSNLMSTLLNRPKDFSKGSWTINRTTRRELESSMVHELIHSSQKVNDTYLRDIKNEKFYLITPDGKLYLKGGRLVPKSIHDKYVPEISVNSQAFKQLVYQNNQQFWEEYPAEILAQRISAERFHPDDKDDDSASGFDSKNIGYTGHGIEQFSVWALKFVEQHELGMSRAEAKTPEGKAKIAKGVRLLCKEMLDWKSLAPHRQTALSGSFAIYARKHDAVHKAKSRTGVPFTGQKAYHIGLQPSKDRLGLFKLNAPEKYAVAHGFGNRKIPQVSAKKSDEFGDGMDGRALRRVILG